MNKIAETLAGAYIYIYINKCSCFEYKEYK